MRDSPLPEDMSAWPEDVYELLGVTTTDDDLTVRRAYTQLIRRFKPELFPDQFRRIRASYEAILHHRKIWEELRERFPYAEFRIGPISENPEKPASDTDETGSPPPPAPQPPDGLEAIWNLAVAGHVDQAYRALRELQERQPQSAGILLRLYWLATIFPDLDEPNAQLKWLTAELMAKRLTGPGVELYRQELQENPHAAIVAGMRFIDVPAFPAQLAEIHIPRWQAALHMQCWHFVNDEFDSLYERIRVNDEECWLRLMFAELDVLLWWRGDRCADALIDRCRTEVDALGYHGLRLTDYFDRFDTLSEISQQWHMVRNLGYIPDVLRELIPQSWYRHFDELIDPMQTMLGMINAAPRDWLDHFDVVHHHNPLLLDRVVELLQQYEWRRDPLPPPREVATVLALTRAAMNHWIGTPYENVRVRLMILCIREQIPPDVASSVLPGVQAVGDPLNRTLPHRVFEDKPLRLVCWAQRLFWSQPLSE